MEAAVKLPVVLGPSRCEGHYHGDPDNDPDDFCDLYEASEIGAPCEAYGRRCAEFYRRDGRPYRRTGQ